VLKYQDFYRHFGIRRAMQMVAPPLIPMQKIQLPQQSILHDVPESGQAGISSDDLLLRNVTGPIYADHVLELTEKRGNPRHTMISSSKLIREYHRKYRKIRQLHELERALSDKRSTIVENYGFLPQLWRYQANLYRPYNKWFNLATTVWQRIAKIAAESQRPQFIECRLPTILPSKVMLNKAQGPVTTKLMNMFPDSESLFILELWKWLGDTHRKDSIISHVPDELLDRVNLIWIESDRWFVLNLGLLNAWRRPSEDEVKAGAKVVKGAIPSISIQNRFLRLLMFLHESRTAQGGEAKPLTEDEKIADAGHTAGEEAAPTHEEKAATIEVPTGKDGKDEEVELEPDMDFGKLPVDAVEETPENNAKIDALIERDLAALDHLHLEREMIDEEAIEEAGGKKLPELHTDSKEGMLEIPALKDISLKEGVMAKANQLADQGLLSAAEYRRLEKVASAYENLPNPYGEGKLADVAKIDLESLAIEPVKLAPEIKGVMDPSMLHTTLAALDPHYIKHVLHRDVVNAVLHVQKAGIAVTDYQVKEVHDAMNHYEAHSVQLTPVRGKVSTFHFWVPKVHEDGTFLANGNKYRLAKQRFDLPIRKTKPGEVSLSSYYAKVFISRSEKKVANYTDWIVNQVRARGMDPDDKTITDMMLGDVYDSNYKVPRIYSILAKNFRTFTIEGMTLFFDYEVRDTLLGSHKDLLKRLERKGLVLAGTWGEKKWPVLVGEDNVFYRVELGKDINLEVVGTVEDMLELDVTKMPKEVAEIRILGKFVPVGLFLAYELGFEGLLKVLGARPVRRIAQGEQLKLSPDEYVITFEDEKLVFHRASDRTGLILQGIATVNDTLSHYPQHLFEKKAIYFNILDRMGLGVRFLREMDLMVDMFIDPITKEVLEKLHEPVTFVGLVLKACELLTTDWAPDETDMEYQRFRGYERVAGAVYQELVRAVRLQRSRGTNNAPIDINPYAVRQAITQDNSVRLVEESNPVHELRSQEEVTFSGTGGRSSRSMVGRTRIFHTNDLGVISESTKDSSDVAITTYLTANPLITDVRGLTKRHIPKETGPTSYLSTSALLAPFSDRDDPKRVNFVAIQNSSTTFCKGQRPNPVRTGYERVIAHRVSDLFAYTAKADGQVTKLSKTAIEVTYKDGTVKVVELGRRFGSTPDYKFPHYLETGLMEGDKVKHGDIIAYNTNYFELDPLDKTQALWKQGVILKTAMMECPETLEDSSIISERAAKLLETQMAKPRDIVVNAKQTIHNLVRVGDRVEVDSILCTIEDPITADQGLFDEKSIRTLKLLAANSPKAKMAGVVEKVECFYHADIDDLSPSLQELAHECDMDRKRRARELRIPYTSGRVDDSLRIDGNPLLMEQVDIRITITADVPAGVGDKGVFANQMKTIFSRVMTGRNETLSGEPIDAIFGYRSFDDRIVASPQLMGTTNSILIALSKLGAKIYQGTAKVPTLTRSSTSK
jgi:hypothetical protein